jgi:hypothetical protein
MVELMATQTDRKTDSQWGIYIDKQKYNSYVEPHKTLAFHVARIKLLQFSQKVVRLYELSCNQISSWRTFNEILDLCSESAQCDT